MLRSIARGLAAGAAGVTALNATTYLDMAVRGRQASSTPERSVEKLAATVGVQVPGRGETRQSRLSGLGSLLGALTGTTVGAAYGALRGLGWRPPLLVGALAATGAAMVAGAGPMTVLGITDPRRWSADDWLSDVVPHVAYGLVTAATFRATE
ncbi:hypothetical protein DI005_04080 [Prauserella sp. PE36]|uniref:DUF1440 domain-containing protein n=1 Tax=Prauserella endophytica TaxID=1592324 RepID=A0ABY2S569_9PSEU|nr:MULTISPECIES: hypothetical protein [Prauserella]PXY34373.1 hypothetical protein BAY59_02220 [Prauserella coralliicola]RBM23136.1 hypothetical protein DI005_04080 [Prauserella sp. PE36]TKG69936.1 hypothetical protein FCN18_17605 [Prauserella endophytica]